MQLLYCSCFRGESFQNACRIVASSFICLPLPLNRFVWEPSLQPLLLYASAPDILLTSLRYSTRNTNAFRIAACSFCMPLSPTHSHQGYTCAGRLLARGEVPNLLLTQYLHYYTHRHARQQETRRSEWTATPVS